MQDIIAPYQEEIEEFFRAHDVPKHPAGLYEPVKYILHVGGKRIRPVLTLMAAKGYDLASGVSLPAAAALEIFHNFTLLHDDIMDNAPLRRGSPTVHKKWDVPTAILSGDVMIFLAQKFLEGYPPDIFSELQKSFNQTAIQICEGQQMDMDFEKKNLIRLTDYMEMIKKKTGVLLGTALQYGGILARQNATEQEILYEAGIKLGLAFQLLDDFLDIYGEKTFGKEHAGDIKSGKKTFFYVKLMEKLPENQKKSFIELYHKVDKKSEDIEHIISLFNSYNLPYQLQNETENLTQQFILLITSSKMQDPIKKDLIRLAEALKNRAA